jgi:hypothetical protein
MAEDWREFEKLVARIERAIGPIGAAVWSPDYIRDSVTGELREVDASIRTKRDGPPIRVLECRDRAKVEDVMWIEQLVTKCHDHGVPTTAVSSAGFSTSAVAKANHYGIETRRISDMTQDEMIGWVRIKEVVNTIYFPVLETVNIVMYGVGAETGGMLHPSVIEQAEAGGGDAPVFIRHADGQGFSACQILDWAARKGLDLFTRVPDDGTKVRKQAVIQFPKGLFHVQTTSGPRDLGKLILGVDVHAEKSSTWLPEKGFSYHGTGRPATYGIETEAEVLGNELLISFHKQADSDTLIVTITKQADKQ